MMAIFSSPFALLSLWSLKNTPFTSHFVVSKQSPLFGCADSVVMIVIGENAVSPTHSASVYTLALNSTQSSVSSLQKKLSILLRSFPSKFAAFSLFVDEHISTGNVRGTVLSRASPLHSLAS